MSTDQEVEAEVHWSSYSSLTTHRACPQRWFYRSIRRLEVLDEDPACERDFGSWWHMLRAADALSRGRTLGSLREVPRELRSTDDGPRLDGATAVVFDVLDASSHWWHSRSVTYQEQWCERLGTALPDRLLSAYERWLAMWEQEIPYERPVAVEMGWGRNLPTITDPLTGEKVDPHTRLVGYVDEIYFDTRRNVLVARDHKTSKSLSSQTSADDMMDSQLQLYAWGAAPTVASWGLGPIGATAYDRTCSVEPRPPTLTMSGKLASRGGQPSLSSSDLRAYVEWAMGPDGQGVPFPGLKKDGSGAGLYTIEESVVERLSTPTAQSVWFQRTLTPLSTHIVKAHLRAAVDSALDQQRTRARAAMSGEAQRNLTSNCRWCDFAKLCRAELIGGPGGEYLLSDYNLRESK